MTPGIYLTGMVWDEKNSDTEKFLHEEAAALGTLVCVYIPLDGGCGYCIHLKEVVLLPTARQGGWFII